MPIFEENELGELIKKPLLVVLKINDTSFHMFSDTWQYLEFRGDLELVTLPRYFQIGGIFIWIQSKEELENLFTVAELPTEFLSMNLYNRTSLNDFYPIDSPN